MYIGIDIGKKGGITTLTNTGDVRSIEPMPLIGNEVDYNRIKKIINSSKDISGNLPIVSFETIGVIFGVGKSSMVSLSQQYGIIKGLCMGMGIEYYEYRPIEWQTSMFQGTKTIQKVGKKAKDTKAMALVVADKLIGRDKFLMTKRSTVPHDGCIDSFLIAKYTIKIKR